MSITTQSVFYYGHQIDETNFSLDFDEGGPELQASVLIGDYSLEEYAVAIANAMNVIGGQVYTVTVDRSTRILTISAPGNFSLLPVTGSRIGTTTFGLAGFTSDKTGSNSYGGDSSSGSEYRPQTVFRKYTPFEDNENAISSSVQEATSGIIETLSFGTRQIMECEIWGISDLATTSNSVVEQNLTGRQDARDFMSFARSKSKMEFMEDRSLANVFHKILLEKTPEGRDGTSFKFKKMFGLGHAPYYTTGNLQFRKVI